jgi:hypothetical protein
VGYFKQGDWEVRTERDYAFICCPCMNGELSFGRMRRIYKGLLKIEKMLKKKHSYWVGYTHAKNDHIMRMYTKVGCKPFHYSLKHNVLWFKKEI